MIHDCLSLITAAFVSGTLSLWSCFYETALNRSIFCRFIQKQKKRKICDGVPSKLQKKTHTNRLFRVIFSCCFFCCVFLPMTVRAGVSNAPSGYKSAALKQESRPNESGHRHERQRAMSKNQSGTEGKMRQRCGGHFLFIVQRGYATIGGRGGGARP